MRRLGNGFQNNPGGHIWDFDKARFRGAPQVALRLTYTGPDGTERTLESDDSFRTAPSPVLFDDYRFGEHYDARLELPGWNAPGFDDSGWQPALPAPMPRGEARLCEAEPIVVTDELKPVSILPEGDGYRTALALVSKPSNENAAFGAFVPCEADGYAKPDEEYLDAMLTVYYRAYLRAANAAAPAELRYVTELHSQSLSAGIKSGATGAVTFTLDKSDMVCDTEHIAYGDNTVTVNAAASYEAVNDTTGEVETATDYYTIQAVWQDGMWLVDRSWMISESDYQNGVFGNQ